MTPSPSPDPKLLLHAYVDGELDPANALIIERELAGDAALAAEHARIVALRRALRERLPPAAASADLRRRVEAAVRLDVVARTPVPTLVYRARQHLVSVTAAPGGATTSSSPSRRAIEGYNLVGWSEDGVSYWAVSDLGAAELDNFVKLFRAAPADK